MAQELHTLLVILSQRRSVQRFTHNGIQQLLITEIQIPQERFQTQQLRNPQTRPLRLRVMMEIYKRLVTHLADGTVRLMELEVISQCLPHQLFPKPRTCISLPIISTMPQMLGQTMEILPDQFLELRLQPLLDLSEATQLLLQILLEPMDHLKLSAQ